MRIDVTDWDREQIGEEVGRTGGKLIEDGGRWYIVTEGFETKLITKKCKQCGKELEPEHGNAKYCSDECSHKAHNRTMTTRQPRECRGCGVIFTPIHGLQRYCTKECLVRTQDVAKEEMKLKKRKEREEPRTCKECGRTFTASHHMQTYCSYQCRRDYYVKLGQEHRAKRSKRTYVRKCKRCGKEFQCKHHNALFCSDGCKYEVRAESQRKYSREYNRKIREARQRLYGTDDLRKKPMDASQRAQISLSHKVGQLATDLRTLTENHAIFVKKFSNKRKYNKALATLNADIEQLRYRLTRLTMHFPTLATELGIEIDGAPLMLLNRAEQQEKRRKEKRRDEK